MSNRNRTKKKRATRPNSKRKSAPRRRRKRTSEAAQTATFLVREGLGILFLCISAFTVLSLATYDRGDPSFNHTGIEAVNNMAGAAGAHLSDVLLLVFGYPAVLIPLFFGWLGIRLMRRNPSKVFWDQFISMPVLGATFCVLSSLLIVNGDKALLLPEGPGGLVGHFGSGIMLVTFGTWGSLILLLPLCLFAFMLVTRFSLISFIESIQNLFHGKDESADHDLPPSLFTRITWSVLGAPRQMAFGMLAGFGRIREMQFRSQDPIEESSQGDLSTEKELPGHSTPFDATDDERSDDPVEESAWQDPQPQTAPSKADLVEIEDLIDEQEEKG
ncbi:MAG: DNA translocase FtsK 4TM domain-containing protein, partial [Magnetococcales bacterium]|nr:DNA translocase FtsK 4TM domain-containing protein [Magnetococcales bacterium]